MKRARKVDMDSNREYDQNKILLVQLCDFKKCSQEHYDITNLPTYKHPRLVQDPNFRENKKKTNLNLRKNLDMLVDYCENTGRKESIKKRTEKHAENFKKISKCNEKENNDRIISTRKSKRHKDWKGNNAETSKVERKLKDSENLMVPKKSNNFSRKMEETLVKNSGQMAGYDEKDDTKVIVPVRNSGRLKGKKVNLSEKAILSKNLEDSFSYVPHPKWKNLSKTNVDTESFNGTDEDDSKNVSDSDEHKGNDDDFELESYENSDTSKSDESSDEDSDMECSSDDSDYVQYARRKPEKKNKKKKKEKKKYSLEQTKILSEYEKLVEKNRNAKMAFLETLKIDEFKEIKENKPLRKPWIAKPPPPPRALSERSTKSIVNFSEDALIEKSVKKSQIEQLRLENLRKREEKKKSEMKKKKVDPKRCTNLGRKFICVEEKSSGEEDPDMEYSSDDSDSEYRPNVYVYRKPKKKNEVKESKFIYVERNNTNDDCQDDGTGSLTDSSQPQPKLVRIFEGGFKSNEDYTYVRGRGRGKYVCGECGLRCEKPSYLKNHMVLTHTDLRPYKCKHCSLAFKAKETLTKHMKTKAHHKKCTELGIIPVPTTIDDSQIDAEALAKQKKGKWMKKKYTSQAEVQSTDSEDEILVNFQVQKPEVQSAESEDEILVNFRV